MRLDELIEDKFMDNEIDRNELIEVHNLSEIIKNDFIDLDDEVKNFDLYISEWIEKSDSEKELLNQPKKIKNNLIIGLITLSLPALILGTLPTSLILGSKLALGTGVLSYLYLKLK